VEKKNNGMIMEKKPGEDVEGRDHGAIEGTVPEFTDTQKTHKNTNRQNA
jgi:hypothetical protein